MMQIPITNKKWHKALVGFSGDTNLWWLKPLKKGFKHCFVVLGDGEICVAVDPIRSHTEIGVFKDIDFTIMREFFEANNYTVVETFVRKPEYTKASLGIFSCVEVAKRLLGIHKASILTPYNLYNFLKNK